MENHFQTSLSDILQEAPLTASFAKVWGFCATLRDDGVGYCDYLEQLAYLIFLRMTDAYSRPQHNRKIGVPAEYAWATLKKLKGKDARCLKG